MFALRKIINVLLMLGVTSAFGGTMGAVCERTSVSYPCEQYLWDFSARALYLKPSYTGNLWENDSLPMPGVGRMARDMDPTWNWGFMVSSSLHMYQGYDVNLNWYHSYNQTARTYVGGVFAGRFITEPKWDAINLEFGQQLNFGARTSLRLHNGFEYTRIKRHVEFFTSTSLASPYAALGRPDTLVLDKMSYNGIGPRMGADMSYVVGNGFGVYINSAASLLVGSLKQAVGGFRGVDTPQNITASKTNFVPEVEAKLGARYLYTVAGSDLSLDVGYMWVNYFDAQTTIYNGDQANFALSGLYFGLRWVSDV